MHVPLSELAPHLVTVKGEMRFYGRSGTINVQLTEGEVARLYERRSQTQINRDEMLANLIRLRPQQHGALAYLHAFARPVAYGQDYMDQATRKVARDELLATLAAAARSTPTKTASDPSLDRYPSWRKLGTDVWFLGTAIPNTSDHRVLRKVIHCQVSADGRGNLFCGRAGERRHRAGEAPGMLRVFDALVAGPVASFLVIMGAYHGGAGYFGPVDVGVAVTGIHGAVADSPGGFDAAPYGANDYRRTDRVTGPDLGNPEEVARRLLRRFLDDLWGNGHDPFP